MSLMKNIIAVVLIIGVMTSCSESNSQGQEEGITISGTVINPAAGVITVDKMMRDRTEPIDTIYVNDDNTFTYVHSGTAGYYRINFFNAQAATVIIDQDDLTIDFDGTNTTGNLMAEGSREMDQIEQFYTAVNEKFGPLEQEINTAFVAANQSGDTEKVDEARDQYMKLMEVKQDYSAELIESYELNLGTFQMISTLNNDRQLELKDRLVQELNDKYPGLFYIEDMVTSMEKARTTAVGVTAPEITLPNPEGEIVTLSSLKGSVVLVDFWAQWCKPC